MMEKSDRQASDGEERDRQGMGRATGRGGE